ncbi:hypothetical protein GCM10022378_02770 [Salinicoccus jeotgali]|uniref:Sulfatase N-terminal domain-containing protein n=1 Tax=Salinicoccus jeotgali TaxID=381634 RepID=A0ABP7EAP3_9STAP
MKLVKNSTFLLGLLAVFLLNSRYWIQTFPTILYDGKTVPVEEINEHTFQGISIIFLFILLVYGLIGKPLTTLLISNMSLFLFYYANKLKFEQRGEVVNYNEIKEVINIRELSNIVDLKMLFVLVTVLLLASFVLFYLESKLYRKLGLSRFRIIRITALVGIIIVSVIFYTDTEKYSYEYFGIEEKDSYIFNPIKEIKRVGFVPNFLINISRNFMEPPDDYSRSNINAISEKYKKESAEYNDARKNDITDEHTIIYLSESFWQNEVLIQNKMPAPFIKKLEEQRGGEMRSLFIGGGTANIEFEMLTSMSLELHQQPTVTSPYIEYFEKSSDSSSILTLVEQNAVIHPYTFSLYNRVDVYDKMGVSKLFSQEDMNDLEKLEGTGRASDRYLTDLVDNKMDDYRMMNVMSMQNHSPYSPGVLEDIAYEPVLKPGILSEEPTASKYGDYIEYAKSYFRQLVKTDSAIEKLIADMEDQKYDVNLIFYGDHAPSFLRGKGAQLQGHTNQAPYFIYQNHDRGDTSDADLLSPMFLVPKLLADGQYKTTPYYYMLVQLYQKGVTGIASSGAYIGDTFVPDEALEEDIKVLVSDYRNVSYNRYFDKNSIGRPFFNKQF